MNLEVHDALERAIELAVTSHRGQRDKGGQPYVLHLFRVMDAVDCEIAKQAAVLHDYIEDVNGTVHEMERHGVSLAAIQAIVLLSRSEDSSYADYVVRLSHNAIARQVKLADLEDNYRIGRVAYRMGHEVEDAMRMQKYALTYQFLSDTIDEQEYRLRMIALE